MAIQETSTKRLDDSRSQCSTPCLTPDVPSPAKAPTRISQACDRCRVKKARCAGGNPCSKCRRSNSLCVFGQKFETNRTVYPKGYVEMLEYQQKQLVAGLQLLYCKVISGEPWVGDKPLEYDNQPRIHDVLAALGLLQPPQESGMQIQDFETYCSNSGGEDPIDEILWLASDTRKKPARSFNDDDPVQLDAWSPSFKVELAGSMDLVRQESPPETDTTWVQSPSTMQSIVIPHQPESVSPDWISIPFDDTLFPQSARTLDDQTYDWELSTLLTTSLAHSQPFEFDIDPTNLMSAATYSRRGHLA